MQGFNWTEKSTARNRITEKFEPVQPAVFFELASSIGATIFFDVGANIGYYAVLMSQLPGIERIHAFEASRETFEHLADNVSLNGMNPYTMCHQRAVSSSNGTLQFQIESELSGINSVQGTSMHSASRFTQVVTVNACTLDSVGVDRGKRCAVKIDVEGHELEVLKGATEVLQGNGVVVQLELYGDSQLEAERVLSGMGYRRIFRVGHDFYFTNVSDLFAPEKVLEIVETAMSRVVDLTLGTWPKPLGLPRITIASGISGDCARAECRISGAPFAEPEFAFNVFIDNQRIGGRDYARAADFDFVVSDRHTGQKIVIQAIARDANRPSKILSTRVPVSQ